MTSGCKRRLAGSPTAERVGEAPLSTTTSRRRRRRAVMTTTLSVVAVAVATTMLPCNEAFGLTMMAYQPPVKSSVNKIQQGRQTRVSTSTKSAYAGAMAPPSPQQQGAAPFEQRMRDIVFGTNDKKKKTTTAASRKPANLVTVDNLLDFKKVVADEEERVVVVRFHSPWCRACKAMAPSFYRMANQHKNVLFVDMPVTPENANLHQGLGVPSLPYGHIYHPGKGLVEEQSVTQKHMTEFQEKLNTQIQQLDVVV